jgi:hypothetical protein
MNPKDSSVSGSWPIGDLPIDLSNYPTAFLRAHQFPLTSYITTALEKKSLEDFWFYVSEVTIGTFDDTSHVRRQEPQAINDTTTRSSTFYSIAIDYFRPQPLTGKGLNI